MKLDITMPQLVALVNLVDSAEAVFEEIPDEQKNIKLIDRMLNKNGYYRKQ